MGIFSVDEEFLEESDYELWKRLHCWYDSEIDEWIEVGDPLTISQKYPWSIDHSGEVTQEYDDSQFNELGKSSLEVEQFISETRPCTKAEPESKDE